MLFGGEPWTMDEDRRWDAISNRSATIDNSRRFDAVGLATASAPPINSRSRNGLQRSWGNRLARNPNWEVRSQPNQLGTHKPGLLTEVRALPKFEPLALIFVSV